MLAIRTILHPTDLSENSEYAFRLACSLARDYGARLIILHATEPPLAFVGEGMLIPTEADLAPLRERLQQYQPRDGKIPVEHRLVQGDSVEEILRAAEEAKCDAIVMGTHGRTGLSRLLAGSVTEQVVRRASCPVVTVRTPQGPVPPAEEPLLAAADSGAEVTR